MGAGSGIPEVAAFAAKQVCQRAHDDIGFTLPGIGRLAARRLRMKEQSPGEAGFQGLRIPGMGANYLIAKTRVNGKH